MDVTPALAAGAQRIESYGPAGFRIAGVDHATSLLLTPQAATPYAATSLADITAESLAPLFADAPEMLLIGTGAKHELLVPELRQQLRARGVSPDSMDTGAACRTFNILLAEGRRVAAVLILPKA